MNPLIGGFSLVSFAAVSAGAFGLQYRMLRRYTVEKAVNTPYASAAVLLVGMAVLAYANSLM